MSGEDTGQLQSRGCMKLGLAIFALLLLVGLAVWIWFRVVELNQLSKLETEKVTLSPKVVRNRFGFVTGIRSARSSGPIVPKEFFNGVSQFRFLRRLELCHTSITSKDISDISKCKSLEFLNLSDTRIDDKALILLAKCTNLKQLNISNTFVSSKGYRFITTKLPHTEIVYYIARPREER